MKEMIVVVVCTLAGMLVGGGLSYVALRMGIRIGWDAAHQDEPLKKPSPPLNITDTE